MAIEGDVQHFYGNWLTAVQDHDSSWFQANLAPDFTVWYVPLNKGFSRADSIKMELCTESLSFLAPKVSKAMESDDIVVAFIVHRFDYVMRPRATLSSDETRLYDYIGESGSRSGFPDASKVSPTLWSGIFRRSTHGTLLAVHNVLLKRLEVDT